MHSHALQRAPLASRRQARPSSSQFPSSSYTLFQSTQIAFFLLAVTDTQRHKLVVGVYCDTHTHTHRERERKSERERLQEYSKYVQPFPLQLSFLVFTLSRERESAINAYRSDRYCLSRIERRYFVCDMNRTDSMMAYISKVAEMKETYA